MEAQQARDEIIEEVSAPSLSLEIVSVPRRAMLDVKTGTITVAGKVGRVAVGERFEPTPPLPEAAAGALRQFSTPPRPPAHRGGAGRSPRQLARSQARRAAAGRGLNRRNPRLL